MSENGGPRSTRAILHGALEELQERRERLEPFVAELREVDHAVKTVEKALGIGRPSGGRRSANGQGGGTQRERILAVLREALDPLAAGQISEATGIGRSSTYAVLSKMKAAGDIVEVDGRYGVATVAVEDME